MEGTTETVSRSVVVSSPIEWRPRLPRALRVAGVPGPFRNPALDPTLGAGFRFSGTLGLELWF